VSLNVVSGSLFWDLPFAGCGSISPHGSEHQIGYSGGIATASDEVVSALAAILQRASNTESNRYRCADDSGQIEIVCSWNEEEVNESSSDSSRNNPQNKTRNHTALE
jgi:hypothetical protein